MIYNNNISTEILPTIDQVMNRTINTGQCKKGAYSNGNYLVREGSNCKCYNITSDDKYVLMDKIPDEVIISFPKDNNAIELAKKLVQILWRADTPLKVNPTYSLAVNKAVIIHSRYDLEKIIELSIIGIDNKEIDKGNRTLSSKFLDRSLKHIDKNISFGYISVSLSSITLMELSND